MELFFFMLAACITFIALVATIEMKNVFSRFILFLFLVIIGLSLYTTGISIPNQGATIVGSIITFTSVSHTIANNPLVLGLAWLCLGTGFVGFAWSTIGLVDRKLDKQL